MSTDVDPDGQGDDSITIDGPRPSDRQTESDDDGPAPDVHSEVEIEIGSSTELVQVKGRVPRWQRDQLKDRRGVTITEAVELGVGLLLGDGDVYEEKQSALRRKAKSLETRIAEIDCEVNALLSEREDLVGERDAAIDRATMIERTREEKRATYETGLSKLAEEHRTDGGVLWPEHHKVTNLAEVGGVDPETVLDDLRDRNPDVPEHAYASSPQRYGGRKWGGVGYS